MTRRLIARCRTIPDESLRSDVDGAGPHKRAVIDRHASECGIVVSDRGIDATAGEEIGRSRSTTVPSDRVIRTTRPSSGTTSETSSIPLILVKRHDRQQRLKRPSQCPIEREFVLVLLCPDADETKSP